MQDKPRHRRLPKTVSIPISEISSPELSEADQTFVKANIDFLTGKIPASLTRVPISEISPGFYIRAEDGTISHSRELDMELDREWVNAAKARIQAGLRPLLDLFWNPHRPPSGGFVCPDDENALAAYTQLGISLVPCRIMRPKPTPRGEAALWVQVRGEKLCLAKAVPVISFDCLPAFRFDEADAPSQSLSALMQECDETATAIRSFHRGHEDAPHYHQMLFAMVQRHKRAIDTVRLLLELNRMEHALAVTRMAYEAFLNFYVDWLSPEVMGPKLQFLAEIRSWGKTRKDEADKLLPRLANFTQFLENTAEKARVSPLGSIYHDIVYPPLSLVAHQSYQNIERESQSFLDSSDLLTPLPPAKLVLWMNVITYALISRVQSDIGPAS